MPAYLSPGVYVEEVPSAIKPIAGVSTSTAGFIGIIKDPLRLPPTLAKSYTVPPAQVTGAVASFDLPDYPVVTEKNTYQVRVGGSAAAASLQNDAANKKSRVNFVPPAGSVVTGSYRYRTGTGDDAETLDVTDETIPPGQVTGSVSVFTLAHSDVVTDPGTYSFKVNGTPVDATLTQPTDAGAKGQVTIDVTPAAGSVVIVDYTIGPLVAVKVGTWDGATKTFALPDYPVVTDANSAKLTVGGTQVNSRFENTTDEKGTPLARATVVGDVPAGVKQGADVLADYITFSTFPVAAAADQPGFKLPTLCTNFTEFKNAFGDFSLDPTQSRLAHAVYGFFDNGGTRCYVVRVTGEAGVGAALAAFELVDEIAIVAAPGLTSDDAAAGITSSANTRAEIISHCTKMGDRFAVFDGPATIDALSKLTKTSAAGGVMPDRTDYGAWYFPWIKVYDPVAQKYDADAPDGVVGVPPSGHIAGVYARVDNARGVHKAPANEVAVGALDVTQPLSKAQQDGLNPRGVNCIRVLNDNILVWGARTIGGDDNADLKYINVRRTLLFLRKSIDEGTQWVVFEPNTPALWQTITRNVTAFLTNVWRSGALFGSTPQEAFYVKCDAETNPQSSIDLGQVVTEVGVAIVRPAEFVIFRISQMAGPGQ